MKNQHITFLITLTAEKLCVVSFQHIDNCRIGVFNIGRKKETIGKSRSYVPLLPSYYT